MKFLFFVIILVSSICYSQETAELEISSINKIELDEIIAIRNNKLLLVNVWASWCIPCREEFPDLVELSNIYKNELDVVAISVDYEEDVKDKVLPFLNKNKVEFPVYLSGFKKDEDLINYFSKEWNGALPGTAIYDVNGKQIKFLEGKQSYESFSSIIETLLK